MSKATFSVRFLNIPIGNPCVRNAKIVATDKSIGLGTRAADRNQNDKECAAPVLREAGAYTGEMILHGPLVWKSSVVSGAIAEKESMPRALRPILHALQETFGRIDREAESLVAEALTISRAEVHGVMSRIADKPVYEASNAGKFFASQPNVKVPEAAAEHIRKFWEPRMRNIICQHPEQGGAGRDPTARRAVELIAEK